MNSNILNCDHNLDGDLDGFIANPVVQLRCISFYINKRLPTFDEFNNLLKDLGEIAERHKLCKKNDNKEELYKRLINHEKIKVFIN